MVTALAPPRKPAVRDDLARALLAWWDRRRRVLPWRAPPGGVSEPYAVWLSEIMLQQTTVASVVGYFERFMARWPRVESLAGAPLDDVLAAWAGLGYYARARNLHACARLIVSEYGGRFPASEAELLKLPGVGPYSAAAIAAIAFNAPCVAQDGNVERVVSRLFAVQRPLPAAKAEIKALTKSFLPTERPGDFTQALMDLGAMVCKPRAPDCAACPLAACCAARRSGTQLDYPIKAPKPAKPHRRGAAFVLCRGEEVLLRRRPAKGLFGGMSEFPSTPLTEDVEIARALAFAPTKAPWRALDGRVRHVFTHFSLELAIFAAVDPGGKFAESSDWRWTSKTRLADAPLPSLMRKVARHAGLTLAQDLDAKRTTHGATRLCD